MHSAKTVEESVWFPYRLLSQQCADGELHRKAQMCGIVGLFAKSPEIEQRLGAHLAAMLAQMSDRGPDSAGVAVYRDPAPAGLEQADALLGRSRRAVARPRERARRRRSAASQEARVRASHAVVLVVAGTPRRPRRGCAPPGRSSAS